MFTFNHLKSIHLEITNRCQASCPMCSRNVHGGKQNPNLVLSDWSLDEFRSIITPEVLEQIEHLFFCGNFGDPILNNYLPDMCQHVKKYNPNIKLRIHTNGGARNKDWWSNLARSLPDDHTVIFGIDGLEDTHHLYRINTNYKTVIGNALTLIEAGGKAEWVFIKFRHNEHQVDEARNIAKRLGFKQFTLKNSNRFVGNNKFEVHDADGRVIYNLEPPTDNVIKFIDKRMIERLQEWVEESVVSCKADKEKELYIDAHKQVYPCCFLAGSHISFVESESMIFHVKQRMLQEHDAMVNLLGGTESITVSSERPLSKILNSTLWQTSWNEFWENKKLLTCTRVCGESKEKMFSKPSDQFVERVKLYE